MRTVVSNDPLLVLESSTGIVGLHHVHIWMITWIVIAVSLVWHLGHVVTVRTSVVVPVDKRQVLLTSVVRKSWSNLDVVPAMVTFDHWIMDWWQLQGWLGLVSEHSTWCFSTSYVALIPLLNGLTLVIEYTSTWMEFLFTWFFVEHIPSSYPLLLGVIRVDIDQLMILTLILGSSIKVISLASLVHDKFAVSFPREHLARQTITLNRRVWSYYVSFDIGSTLTVVVWLNHFQNVLSILIIYTILDWLYSWFWIIPCRYWFVFTIEASVIIWPFIYFTHACYHSVVRTAALRILLNSFLWSCYRGILTSNFLGRYNLNDWWTVFHFISPFFSWFVIGIERPVVDATNLISIRTFIRRIPAWAGNPHVLPRSFIVVIIRTLGSAAWHIFDKFIAMNFTGLVLVIIIIATCLAHVLLV